MWDFTIGYFVGAGAASFVITLMVKYFKHKKKGVFSRQCFDENCQGRELTKDT